MVTQTKYGFQHIQGHLSPAMKINIILLKIKDNKKEIKTPFKDERGNWSEKVQLVVIMVVNSMKNRNITD